MSHPRNDLTFARPSSTLFQRVWRHARAPASLPSLFCKNIRYALARRRPEFWNERGRERAARGRHDEALACYDRALAIRDDAPEIWANRGRALRNLDRSDEAETSLREALRLKPDFANAYTELGRLLDCLGRFEEAEMTVRRALRCNPTQAFAHCLLGYILYHLGRAAEAQASYRAALQLEPESRKWRVYLGQALLLAGELTEGWNEFEWRWRAEGAIWIRSLLEVPFWNGQPIGDRSILLLAEQGHGDTLQFCRYVPRVAAGARRTILAIQPSLVRLLSRLPGVSEIISDGGRPSRPDLWCPLMSLPHVYGTHLETIPRTVPYIAADPADVIHWRERLAGLNGLRVGLCWAGGQFNSGQLYRDRRRSIRLETLARFAEIPGVRFFSLQIGAAAAEAARAPWDTALHDFTKDLRDFADTAALIENLDLVVSVDTAVVHLAGALGKPVWLLNRFDTCWRWLKDREDSPWYPTLRQFRQAVPGDWESALSRAHDALSCLAAGDQGQLRVQH